MITGLSAGGAETMLLKILKGLDFDKFSPSVISLTTDGEIGPKINELGIPVFALRIKSLVSAVLAFVWLVKYFLVLKPNVVHTWMYHADLFGGLAARLSGTRAVVWSIRQSNLSPHLNKRSTLCIVKLCAVLSRLIPKKILCCSKVAHATHLSVGYYEPRITVIPNGFDLEHFRPNKSHRTSVRDELGVDQDTLIVGFVARYDRQKNHDGFFKVAARLQEVFPRVHFVLVGSDVHWDNQLLVDAIELAGVWTQTHLLNSRNDIARLMASFDILVSTTHGEGFSNVIGEAMSCGVPCVVTDVGDSAEIVGETGKVARPGDMNELARHAIDILSKSSGERDRLGLLARERIRREYGIDQIRQRYTQLYSLVAGDT